MTVIIEGQILNEKFAFCFENYYQMEPSKINMLQDIFII